MSRKATVEQSSVSLQCFVQLDNNVRTTELSGVLIVYTLFKKRVSIVFNSKGIHLKCISNENFTVQTIF